MKSTLLLLITIILMDSSRAQCDTTFSDSTHKNRIGINIMPMVSMARKSPFQFGISYARYWKKAFELNISINYVDLKNNRSSGYSTMVNDTMLASRQEYLTAAHFGVLQAGINHCNYAKKACFYWGIDGYLGKIKQNAAMHEYTYNLSGGELEYQSNQTLYTARIYNLIYGFCIKLGFHFRIHQDFGIKIGCEPYLGWYIQDAVYTYQNNFRPDREFLRYRPNGFCPALFNNISFYIRL